MRDHNSLLSIILFSIFKLSYVAELLHTYIHKCSRLSFRGEGLYGPPRA